MASQDACDTDSENTCLLVNNSNISLLFLPDIFMVTSFYLAQSHVVSTSMAIFFIAIIDGCLKY